MGPVEVWTSLSHTHADHFVTCRKKTGKHYKNLMHMAVNIYLIITPVAVKSSIDPFLLHPHQCQGDNRAQSCFSGTLWVSTLLRQLEVVFPPACPGLAQEVASQNNSLRRCLYQVPDPPHLLLLVCSSCSLTRPWSLLRFTRGHAGCDQSHCGKKTQFSYVCLGAYSFSYCPKLVITGEG